MKSTFFSDLFGLVFVNEDQTAIMNENRAKKGKSPLRFGQARAQPGEGAYDEAALAIELQLLDAERLQQGLPPITGKWSSKSVRFDYGKNREGRWKAHHMIQHAEETMDTLEVVFPGV
jgi:hypothetical protein